VYVKSFHSKGKSISISFPFCLIIQM